VTAGTSGASEPSWNTAVGGTTNDGSVVWTAIEARTRPSTVASVGDPRALFTAGAELSGLPDQFFRFGLVTWITGQNRGMKFEVKTDTGGPKTIELFEQTPFDIRAGDQFEVRAGCDKLRDTCRDKFDNIYNFRGEPFVPGFDRIFLTPDAK